MVSQHPAMICLTISDDSLEILIWHNSMLTLYS